jgi:RNA polymerase sigma-70 factor (ECF subfamily)
VDILLLPFGHDGRVTAEDPSLDQLCRPAPGDEFSRLQPSYLQRDLTRRKDDVMSADTRLEELGVNSLGGNGLGQVDEPAFSGLAERHRRELHVHCYRMLGSFQDAEDTVQETFLRAWRRRETFEGRSTFRAWLYRIATNACLDLLAERRPEPATGGEVLWLQPYPDRLLDDLPADDADEPEAVALARETIELAYVVAVQHLAPRPRAVLILRDVLGWPAKDVAELLGDSVNSVNSALQRARAGLREHLPAERQDWTGGEEDTGTRELVRRYTDASVATDIDRLAALLRDDVRCSMPPTPGLYVGRDAVLNDWVESGFEGMKHLRTVLTSVNRQPAVAFYQWRQREGAYLPLTIDVLRITGGAITEIVTFHDDQFPRLGLPERLPADDTK